MPSYKAPVKDTLFLLTDVFDYQRYNNLPGFSDAPLDLVEAVLGEGGKFAEEVLQPLNRSGDIEGCKRHDDGSVTTPKGFKEAYKAYAEGGWVGVCRRSRLWRPGPAELPVARPQRIRDLGEPGFRHVSRAYHGRDRGAPHPWQRGAEERLSAQR